MEQESIEEIKKKAEKFESQYNRLKQEFKDYIENSKKNEEKKRQEIKTDFSKRLLAVADSLNRIAGLSNDNCCETMKNLSENTRKNIEVVYSQMLSASGLIPIEPRDGDTFDAQRHIAVGVEYVAPYPDNTILRVIRKGYMLENNVVRPAEVIVMKNPAVQKVIKPSILDRMLGWLKPFIFADISQKMDEIERLQKERIEKLLLEMDSLKNILSDLNARAKQTNEVERIQKEKVDMLVLDVEASENTLNDLNARAKQTNEFEHIQKEKMEKLVFDVEALKNTLNDLNARVKQTNELERIQKEKTEEKMTHEQVLLLEPGDNENKRMIKITEVDTIG